jgi:hypothetical protein
MQQEERMRAVFGADNPIDSEMSVPETDIPSIFGILNKHVDTSMSYATKTKTALKEDCLALARLNNPVVEDPWRYNRVVLNLISTTLAPELKARLLDLFDVGLSDQAEFVLAAKHVLRAETDVDSMDCRIKLAHAFDKNMREAAYNFQHPDTNHSVEQRARVDADPDVLLSSGETMRWNYELSGSTSGELLRFVTSLDIPIGTYTGLPTVVVVGHNGSLRENRVVLDTANDIGFAFTHSQQEGNRNIKCIIPFDLADEFDKMYVKITASSDTTTISSIGTITCTRPNAYVGSNPSWPYTTYVLLALYTCVTADGGVTAIVEDDNTITLTGTGVTDAHQRAWNQFAVDIDAVQDRIERNARRVDIKQRKVEALESRLMRVEGNIKRFKPQMQGAQRALSHSRIATYAAIASVSLILATIVAMVLAGMPRTATYVAFVACIVLILISMVYRSAVVLRSESIQFIEL